MELLVEKLLNLILFGSIHVALFGPYYMTSVADIKTLSDAGAHFGYPRTRRHPTAARFLYSTKDRTDIFDLEETQKRLDAAKEFVATLAQAGKPVLFVGGKHEAAAIVKLVAEKIGAPYVAGRWMRYVDQLQKHPQTNRIT